MKKNNTVDTNPRLFGKNPTEAGSYFSVVFFGIFLYNGREADSMIEKRKGEAYGRAQAIQKALYTE